MLNLAVNRPNLPSTERHSELADKLEDFRLLLDLNLNVLGSFQHLQDSTQQVDTGMLFYLLGILAERIESEFDYLVEYAQNEGAKDE